MKLADGYLKTFHIQRVAFWNKKALDDVIVKPRVVVVGGRR